MDMNKILAKFAGTPEQRVANEREEANRLAWKTEHDEMEQDHYLRMAAAREAGDETLAQQIAAEFRQKRSEIEKKHGFA